MLAHVLRGCIPSTIFIVYRSVVPLNKEALKMSLFPTKTRVIGWFRTQLEVDGWMCGDLIVLIATHGIFHAQARLTFKVCHRVCQRINAPSHLDLLLLLHAVCYQEEIVP